MMLLWHLMHKNLTFIPFSEALGFPSKKDYIVINRGSKDGNLWSRYNRWFSKSVIEKIAEIKMIQIANIDLKQVELRSYY